MEIAPKGKCSGCYACYSTCKFNAITMKEDEDGFMYPSVDKEICVSCGLCKKTCPVLNEYKGNKKGKAIACINKNEMVRLKSSSGGVFSLIGEYVLNNGGVVFGVVFDEDFTAHHTYAQTIDELEKMYGSKYMQSKLKDAYKKAEEFLESGRMVLFSGTPCQTGGIKAYLKKDYPNLILQDIICHGVPSPKVFKKYLKHKEKNYGKASLESLPSFRNKTTGWKKYSVNIKFKEKEYINTFGCDTFMKAFLNDLCLRPSCYNCHFKAFERQSDITLADFWGIEKIMPEMDDDKGTSLVILNSKKGGELFEKIKEKLIYKETNLGDASLYNESLYKSAKKPSGRENFLKEVNEENFDVVVSKYTKTPLIAKLKRKIKTVIKSVLR